MLRVASEPLDSSNGETFKGLLLEAQSSHVWGETRRALDFYQQALAAAPEGLPTEVLADIVEAMRHLRERIAEGDRRLARLRVELAASSAAVGSRVVRTCRLLVSLRFPVVRYSGAPPALCEP